MDAINESDVKENIITILCACLYDDSALGLSCANRLSTAFTSFSKAVEPKSCLLDDFQLFRAIKYWCILVHATKATNGLLRAEIRFRFGIATMISQVLTGKSGDVDYRHS